MERVVLGLGSNRSFNGLDPCGILFRACTEICSFLHDAVFSSIYRTGAMYVSEQDDFYNMVASGCFDGTARELLDRIHAVEDSYGRDRSKEIRFGPRPLDIDIELFGDLRIDEPDLVVPHERMTERAFVLVPFLEILDEDADSWNSGFYRDCLASLSDQKIEMYMNRSDFPVFSPDSGLDGSDCRSVLN